MQKEKSIYRLVTTYAPDVQLGLYTPAHQGTAGRGGVFPDELYRLDRPYLRPDSLAAYEESFSRLYGTGRTFFLTGGTTQGILAGCLALSRRGSRVLLARNSHVSFINGSILAGLEPEFIPTAGTIPGEEEILASLDRLTGRVSALVLTNPGYEGTGIEIGRIAGRCRETGVLLAVDEAHGAHFPFTAGAPASAVGQPGCDLVFNSLHKYLGSFTQTGLAHLPAGSRIEGEEYRRALELFESTTRSNLLMLSIEEALERAFSREGRREFSRAAERV
ncbi:MAG: aminotransferase class I/II-fold pyridoxal phosphate-dependent enzyme, partial [Candidatus Glassbacteria bacterium]